MPNEHAEIGDTIEILYGRDGDYWYHRHLTVIERPSDAIGGNCPGDAWFLANGKENEFPPVFQL